MINERLTYYRSILLEKRKVVLRTIEQLQELSQVKDGELVEYKKYSDNLADLGSDTIGREQAFMLLSRELKFLNQIDDALNRMDFGKFGICRMCGGEICHERLEAVPTTDVCVPCKKKFFA